MLVNKSAFVLLYKSAHIIYPDLGGGGGGELP